MFQSVPLTQQHNVEKFSCGIDQLDEWLRAHARHAAVMNTARTFVWADQNEVVVGYYSLAGHRRRGRISLVESAKEALGRSHRS